MLRYEELVLQNWRRVCDGNTSSSAPSAGSGGDTSSHRNPVPVCSDKGLRIGVPVFGTVDEERVITTLVRMHVAGASLVSTAVRAQEAAASDDGGSLIVRLLSMRQAVLDMRAVIASLSFAPDSPNSVDPVSVAATLWQLLLQPWASSPHQRTRRVATARDAPLLSGTQSPLIHLLDAVLGRPRAYSQLGTPAASVFDTASYAMRH